MKIKTVSVPSEIRTITTDMEKFSTFQRHSSNYDNVVLWVRLIGENWVEVEENLQKRLESEYQRFITMQMQVS